MHSQQRRRPLAKCIAALFALAAPEAFAITTWTVTTCADHGPGSLRDIIANSAQSGDYIDLSQLPVTYACSTISLNTGAINVLQDELTLSGPEFPFTVDVSGTYNGNLESDRILNHTGTGILGLYNVGIEDGDKIGSGVVLGGCVYSKGTVYMSHARVHDCSVQSTSGVACGGGIFAKETLIANASLVNANVVHAATTGKGGGLCASFGPVIANKTTVSGNYATLGGGVFAQYGASFYGSTISGNSASDAGGIYAYAPPNQGTLTISNSTISGNTSAFTVGGVMSNVPTTVTNSTIAFNTAMDLMDIYGDFYAAGLVVSTTHGTGRSNPLTLQSTIVSNNTYGASANESDVSTVIRNGGSVTITASNNLIRVAQGPVRPPATVSCPLLGPLRDNGGTTFTHALLSHSPAIDAGNNSAALIDDQRGPGFARIYGTATDIGAYEVQADVVFNAGFDACPILE